MECEFTDEDLKKILYWTISKFRSDKFHHQLGSVKGDYIGGFCDRWVNKAEEFITFRELLKNKEYNATIDYFLYGDDKEKNAPDVLGLEDSDGAPIVIFAVYGDGNWVLQPDMPGIEVKNVKRDQFMIAIKESQMHDNYYYVLVESNYREDYLTLVLDSTVFDNKYLQDFAMNNKFIASDVKGSIALPSNIDGGASLDAFRLMGIFTGNEVKRYCKLCDGKTSEVKALCPRYISDCQPTQDVNNNSNETLSEGFLTYEIEGDDRYLPIYIKFLSDGATATIIRKLKTYFCVNISGRVEINGYNCGNGDFRFDFKTFERGTSANEYVGCKVLFDKYAEDVTDSLLEKFDELAGDIDNG